MNRVSMAVGAAVDRALRVLGLLWTAYAVICGMALYIVLALIACVLVLGLGLGNLIVNGEEPDPTCPAGQRWNVYAGACTPDYDREP